MGAGLLAAAPVQAQADAPTATVNTGRLNVRAGPSVSYSVITRIAEGTSVSLLARNTTATWVRIRLASGLEGWVNASYLRATAVIGDLPVSHVTTSATPVAAGVGLSGWALFRPKPPAV